MSKTLLERDRDYWDSLVVAVNVLVLRLQEKPRSMKLGINYASPGSILNAYREGDLSFPQAVTAFEKWKKS